MKIAGVQMDVVLGDVPGNLERMLQRLTTASRAGAEYVIFPECALTGYCFTKRQEAAPFAQAINGPAVQAFIERCQDLNCYATFGLIESDGEKLYNAAALVGPEGLISSYRKVHLPFIGIDRFLDYGDRPFAVHEVAGVRVGLNICYDAGFPEPARCLTLLGGDLIVLPTNWPTGAECSAEYAINTRAMENTVYYAAINRIGEERGTRFIGQSRICDPLGRTLACGSGSEEAILYAEIDVTLSRTKHLIRVPHQNEINRIADRRPEMYTQITEPHPLARRRGQPEPI